MDILSGWKTYVAAGLVAVTTFSVQVGWLTPEQSQALLGLAAALGLFGLRQAVQKLEKKAE